MCGLDEFQAIRKRGPHVRAGAVRVRRRGREAQLHSHDYCKCMRAQRWWRRPSTGEWHLGPHPPLVGKERMLPAGEWRTDMLLDDSQYYEKFNRALFLMSTAQAYPQDLNRYFAVKLATRAKHIADRRIVQQPLVT
eukprot:5526838-Pyramimonas_sp.AAC.1